MSGHNYHTDCHKGKYQLINPDKYMKDVALPEYKSMWEHNFFAACDVNPFVTRWGYEPFPISYYSPMYMKQTMYKPDVYLECRYPDGREAKYLIEIKPVAYSVPPKMPKAPPPGSDAKKLETFNKRMNQYNKKNMEVMVNYAKWQAAEAWCMANGINWFVANEKNMKGLFDTTTII